MDNTLNLIDKLDKAQQKQSKLLKELIVSKAWQKFVPDIFDHGRIKILVRGPIITNKQYRQMPNGYYRAVKVLVNKGNNEQLEFKISELPEELKNHYENLVGVK